MFSSGRQDYGILRSSLLLLASDPRFEVLFWAGGMHLGVAQGRSIDHVLTDGIRVHREISFVGDSETVSEDTARALSSIAAALRESRPDALLLVGDRTETLAAATAAVIERVPVAHLHGGEETEGAIDNLCRHAITKLSHLHLVSHDVHARRVAQMGEDPECVAVVGAPGLDNLYRDDLPSDEEVQALLSGPSDWPIVLVTLHPATIGDSPEMEVEELAMALDGIRARLLVTAPNVDAGGSVIRVYWERWAASRAHVTFVPSLGERLYWGVLKRCAVVVGNSSSGIIEAPAAGAAVVNVGDRQKGRLRYGLIRDVPSSSGAIRRALEEVIGDPGRARSGTFYPAGPAAPRIVQALAAMLPGCKARKSFVDLEGAPLGGGKGSTD